jgi:hypothetical protein
MASELEARSLLAPERVRTRRKENHPVDVYTMRPTEGCPACAGRAKASQTSIQAKGERHPCLRVGYGSRAGGYRQRHDAGTD